MPQTVPRVQWVVFWYFKHSKEPSNILTLVIHYVLGPEHGPSVDCLSTSPKAALGNECKQQKVAASTVYLNVHLYRECMTGKRCGILSLVSVCMGYLKDMNLYYNFFC